MSLIVGFKYRIVGIGVMDGDEEDFFHPGVKATGYISTAGVSFDPVNPVYDSMVPVNLSYFGEGKIGEEAVYLGP